MQKKDKSCKMKRITSLEHQYISEVLDNEFRTSKKSIFNQRLEHAFVEKFNIGYAIAHNNGTCTMHTALAALGVGAGDEVIVPALTMGSPTLAVLHNNSVPVFADISPDTFTLDAASVRRCITPRTKAILSVSLYGLPPDYDALLDVCHEHNLYLIEDNAQCFSGKYKGKLVGSFGQFASYSFQGSKHLTSGEGGMLITCDALLAQKARQFCGLGFNGLTATGSTLQRETLQQPDFDRHITLGYNFKMSELCAAVALAQVERADELVEQKKTVAKLFHEVVKDCDFLVPQAQPEGYENVYWTYAMMLKTEHSKTDWQRFRALFLKNGGDSFYAAWKLTYNEPFFQNVVQQDPRVWQQYQKNLCPKAEFVQPRLIQLKTNYWDLAEAEQQAEILYKTSREFQ